MLLRLEDVYNPNDNFLGDMNCAMLFTGNSTYIFKKTWRCSMTSQQEYESFIAKFLKSISEVRDDFSKLSPGNQARVTQEINDHLKGFGYAITISDLLRRPF